MKRIKWLCIEFFILITIHFTILRKYPQTNLGYQLWKMGAMPKLDGYQELFYEDHAYRRTFKGKPIVELKRLFPNLKKGTEYPP